MAEVKNEKDIEKLIPADDIINDQEETKKEKRIKFSKFLNRYYKASIFLLVVAIGVLGYYLLAPKYQEISLGGQYNINTLTQKKEFKQRYLRDLKQLSKNYEEINQSNIERLNQILPQEKDIPSLFVQLQALTKEAGFILNSISINQESAQLVRGKKTLDLTAGEIKKLSINLSLLGEDYNALKRLLTTIESNLRLFDVNAVYFSPGSEGYSLSLFTYYFMANN